MASAIKTSWNEIKKEQLSDTITRKFIYGEKVMASYLEIKKGSVVPEHHHESEQITWILEGELLFEIDGKEISVKAGEVLVIPSQKPHKATAMVDTIDVDLFSPIRDDWISGTDSYLRGKQD